MLNFFKALAAAGVAVAAYKYRNEIRNLVSSQGEPNNASSNTAPSANQPVPANASAYKPTATNSNIKQAS